MAKFKNTLVGKFIRKSPIAKGVNTVLSGVTGGVLGTGLVFNAIANTGKDGSKGSPKTVQQTPQQNPEIKKEVIKNETDKNSKSKIMFEKIKGFIVENWKFLVPGVVIFPIAIWYFFLRKKQVTKRR